MQVIKFNQDSITAILEGRKTMTRRPIKGISLQHDLGMAYQEIGEKEIYNPETGELSYAFSIGYEDEEEYEESIVRIIPKYKIGETVFVKSLPDEYFPSEMTEKEARIFLKITNIKVERLQDISEEDCIKEGVTYGQSMLFIDKGEGSYQRVFEEEIWNKLPYKAPYDWESNPYVFVYEFEVVK